MNEDKRVGPDSIQEALLAVTGVLDASGIRHVTIDGLAVAEHGVIRATRDVDLLLAVPAVSLPGLLQRLREAGCEIDATRVMDEWPREHLTRIRYRSVPIDWLAPVIPLFQLVLDRARSRSILGRSVRVADAEGLILLKLVAFRHEDRRDVEALAVACGAIDWAFVREQLQTVYDADDERLTWLASVAAGSAR